VGMRVESTATTREAVGIVNNCVCVCGGGGGGGVECECVCVVCERRYPHVCTR
jgi:hypothetical protein